MDITVIIAISIIALGFLILTGLAVWLAVDRQRRSQQTPTVQPPRQSGPKAAYQPPGPASSPAATPGPTEAKQAPSSQSAPARQKAPANPPDPQHSGEYPAAELYDQTLLPTPPKRRTRKTES
jgi:cytoskeletal protein RodZ